MSEQFSSYTIRPGDTMFRIAMAFRVSLNELIAANPHIQNPNIIYPGSILCIPTTCQVPNAVALTAYPDHPPWVWGIAYRDIDQYLDSQLHLPPPGNKGIFHAVILESGS